MLSKLQLFPGLLLRALSHPGKTLGLVRKRGLPWIVRTLLRNDAQHFKQNLENFDLSMMEPTIESMLKVCSAIVSAISDATADRYLVELRNGSRFYIRKKCCVEDMNVLWITFYLEKYRDDESLEGRIVLDVGASIGDTAVYYAKKGARVYSYEPSPDMYQIALDNMRLNGVDVELYQYGIGAKDETLPLTLGPSGADWASITLFEGEDATPQHGTEQIEVKSLSDILRRLPGVQLLKMNCEGCEYPAILSLTEEELRKIRRFIIQYHKAPTPLLDRLQSVGFKTSFDHLYIHAAPAQDPR